ncbi:MAG: hypothetical protein IH898_15055, partial [Planctomycetes bacterium]|nr:hypothetical protein [Planctomycetota bacterium]
MGQRGRRAHKLESCSKENKALSLPVVLRTDAELNMGASWATKSADKFRQITAENDEVETLIRLVPEADVIFTCYAPITADVLAAGRRLRGIVKYGVGVDSIDVDAASARGIPVAHCPEYGTETVADHAFALLLNLARRITTIDQSMHQDDPAEASQPEIPSPHFELEPLGPPKSLPAEVEKVVDQQFTPQTSTGVSYEPEQQCLRPALQVDQFIWPKICDQIIAKAAWRFDQLTSQLIVGVTHGRKTLALSSCNSGEGCTTALLCIARRLSALGIKVALVDAHFATARLAEQLRVPHIRITDRIEQVAGMNIDQIFSLSGQNAYR